MDTAETTEVSANDGQTVRHQSTSIKERIDKDTTVNEVSLRPSALVSVCDQAPAFAETSLQDWNDIENHARMLAPMMAIQSATFEKAKNTVGPRRASTASFIMLQLGKSIKDFGAYFHSITLGKRRDRFDPEALIDRLSKQQAYAI